MDLEDGWYLMSTSDLERELARARGEDAPESEALRLSVEEALAYRDAGNLPDERGRTLRLVLRVEGSDDLSSLSSRRRLYEPDYHAPPAWRREGSRPVNVVPLKRPGVPSGTAEAWWEQSELKALEDEWARSGTVEGVVVPAAYRGFVYKTALSLRAAGIAVTAQALADSISRWVPPEDAARIRKALVDANR